MSCILDYSFLGLSLPALFRLELDRGHHVPSASV